MGGLAYWGGIGVSICFQHIWQKILRVSPGPAGLFFVLVLLIDTCFQLAVFVYKISPINVFKGPSFKKGRKLPHVKFFTRRDASYHMSCLTHVKPCFKDLQNPHCQTTII